MGLFHRHVWMEINRQMGFKTHWDHFVLESYWSSDEAQTCITYNCDRCHKNKQEFLKGHVSREKNPIPKAFTDSL
jgi:hypothetical protein